MLPAPFWTGPRKGRRRGQSFRTIISGRREWFRNSLRHVRCVACDRADHGPGQANISQFRIRQFVQLAHSAVVNFALLLRSFPVCDREFDPRGQVQANCAIVRCVCHDRFTFSFESSGREGRAALSCLHICSFSAIAQSTRLKCRYAAFAWDTR